MKTGRLILRVVGIIGVLAALLALLPSPVLADQLNPTSTPTVTPFVFKNLLAAGDKLMVWEQNIPYASIPDALSTEAFTWSLIGDDGATVLGQTKGYVSILAAANGYGYAVSSLYFSASDNFTWGSAYTLRLSGTPAVFTTPPVYEYPVSASSYSTLSDQADEQAELASWVLTTALDLNTRWGLTSSTSLLSEQESGTYLSQQGEAVFRGSIYGLQGLCPAVFQFSPLTITATNRTWTNTYSTNVSSQYAGTWVGTSQQAGADLMGTTYDLTSVILTIIIAVAVLAANLIVSQKAGSIWSALLDVVLVLALLGRLGLYELSFLGLLAALSWVYTSGKTWGIIS